MSFKVEELEAERLRSGLWAVKPKGQLGTIGWYPRPWEVVCVRAASERDAIRLAVKKMTRRIDRA